MSKSASSQRATDNGRRTKSPSSRAEILLCAFVSLWLFTAHSAFRIPRSAIDDDWPNYGRDQGGTRYSPLDAINRSNVKNLKLAWTYRSGDPVSENKTTIECTPIVVEGVMYVTTPFCKVAALDPATGHENWKFDPYRAVRRPSNAVNRGVAYWSDGRPQGARRILMGTSEGRLISLDARNGKPDPAFGSSGEVDLRAGVERDLKGLAYGVTSPPAIFEDIVIVGFYNGEGPPPSSPGDMRAFDVRSGKELWRFHTMPRPGEFGNDTWEHDSWKDRGGANAWGGLSIDGKRGWVFGGLGSAGFDFYGGDRKGQNLFANSVLVLDARTGKRIWHFQVVRHDLWDYDLPVYPNLVTVRHNGKVQEAVAQVTKTGYVFLLDRETGKPLFDVVERAVPASDVPGETAWPTQIFPLKPPPFSRQYFGEEDVTNISKEAHDQVLGEFKRHRSGPIFTPQSLEGTVELPGFHGGANWSGASFDPNTGILYVNSNNVPWLNTLVKNPPEKGYPYDHTGYFRFTDAEGYPGVKPPWGNLTAIDLNRGEFAWQITLGEFPELTARGIPPTGTENFGGTVVTSGGLVFIGGTMDEKFHAFDKSSGELLWQYKLEAGGYATPCTYAAGGRQFVVIAAGGGGKLRTKSGDAFVAFALPQR
jgi:quinoprotein glucose dehydrogenase